MKKGGKKEGWDEALCVIFKGYQMGCRKLARETVSSHKISADIGSERFPDPLARQIIGLCKDMHIFISFILSEDDRGSNKDQDISPKDEQSSLDTLKCTPRKLFSTGLPFLNEKVRSIIIQLDRGWYSEMGTL